MANKRKYPDGTKRMSLFMPPDLKTDLDRCAEATGRSATEVIHDALRQECAPWASAKRLRSVNATQDTEAFG